MVKKKLEPCNHTKLMNYIIGMCKKHKDWITVLADLGYSPELVEQKIRTSSEDIVKPDIIVTSTKLVHSLVFECKGGITIDQNQIKRYSALEKTNLLRWVGHASPMFTPDNFRFDVGISDLEENHPFVVAEVRDLPIITFGASKVVKSGEFRSSELNAAFKNPISLSGKVPPLSYYPFCEEDKDPYIATFVIRGLLAIAIKKAKGGPTAFDESLITRDEILKSLFNPIIDALAKEHQGRLKERIKEIIRWVMAKEEMKEAFGTIEQQAGYKISRPLEKLANEASKFIENLETQQSLMPFFKPCAEGSACLRAR